MNSGWTETAAQLLTDRSIQGFNEAKKRLSKPMDGLRDDNRDLRLLVYKQEEQIKDLQRQIQELQS